VKFQHNGKTHSYVSSPDQLRLHVEEIATEDVNTDLRKKIYKYEDTQRKGQQSVAEAQTFEVDVEGLPKMYIKATSPGKIKSKLRSMLKQPSMINDVQRITPADERNVFRAKAQGRDEDPNKNIDEASTKPDTKPPFEGPYRTAGKPRKDEFGNTIKPKNVAKHLAKKGMKDVKEGSSAALRMYKALQKSKEERERQQRLNKPYVDKLLDKKPEEKKESISEMKASTLQSYVSKRQSSPTRTKAAADAISHHFSGKKGPSKLDIINKGLKRAREKIDKARQKETGMNPKKPVKHTIDRGGHTFDDPMSSRLD